ncbi:MAG: hypothetical protein OIF48_05200 [Silicimonas sp.]|nr:hypothetical protein [Silicimonas sp.]
MIPVMCIVQDGQIPPHAEETLKTRIGDFTRRAFDASADIDWIVVSEGSGFTAAAPSTSVIASLHANRPLAQADRKALLNELCDICMDETGRSANEIVTSIRNPKD